MFKRSVNQPMTVNDQNSKISQYNDGIKPGLIAEIQKYKAEFPDEKDTDRILDFIESNSNLFGRDTVYGHITCGAWILDDTHKRVVLVRHRRLARWIQPGGHIEPFETPFESAVREAAEETGLEGLVPWQGGVFNLSVHLFPEGKDGPAHYHLDFRYLFLAPEAAKLNPTDETDGVEWVPLAQIREYTDEDTILEMTEKTEKLIRLGKITAPQTGDRR